MRGPLARLLLVSAIGSLVACGASESGQEIRLDDPDLRGLLDDQMEMSIGVAYARALDEVDPLARHLMLTRVYSQVDASNFSLVRDVYLEHDPERTVTIDDMKVLGNLWGRFDPEQGISEVMKISQATRRRHVAEELINTWLARDGGDAVSRAVRDHSSELGDQARYAVERSLAEALARRDELDTLFTLIGELDTRQEHRIRTLRACLRELNRVERDSFLDWAEQLHADTTLDPERKKMIIVSALDLLVKLRDFEAAVDWYPSIADGPYSGDALSVIAERWGRVDPEAAFDYLADRPDSEQPEMARRAVAYVWLQSEPAAASAYLQEAIDQRRMVDSVALPLAQYLITQDLASAMELGLQIPAADEREAMLKDGIRRWVRRDKAGADLFLANHEVPESVREMAKRAEAIRVTRRPKPKQDDEDPE